MGTKPSIEQKSREQATNSYGASMTKLVSLCKRRGFVFPSSEIYGGLAATWDYGPLGVELKKNIERAWWREMTRGDQSIVGLDAAIMMHPKVWEASGHLKNFSDLLIDCKSCKARFRADHLSSFSLENRKCPDCQGELTEPRQFNLMFPTHIGSVVSEGSVVYLRPETAQGIFVNFKNVLDTQRLSIPFGIAQVGKAFRNEITTKNFIFRTCEFEQMEMQFFIQPGKQGEWFSYWKAQRMRYYEHLLGILPENLRFHRHVPEKLAHYAEEAEDIEYLYPFGWEELEGIHSRTDFDLTSHNKTSGKEICYRDPLSNETYVPYVIETSAGLSRTVLVVLMDAYHEESLPNGEVRTVLHLHPRIAPITAAVFPLVKKDGLPELAKKIMKELGDTYLTFYDQSGAIGRRYRRMDEVGTPFCITIDYETKENGSVTLRLRDSMEQIRLSTSSLVDRIEEEVQKYSRLSSGKGDKNE